MISETVLTELDLESSGHESTATAQTAADKAAETVAKFVGGNWYVVSRNGKHITVTADSDL